MIAKVKENFPTKKPDIKPSGSRPNVGGFMSEIRNCSLCSEDVIDCITICKNCEENETTYVDKLIVENRELSMTEDSAQNYAKEMKDRIDLAEKCMDSAWALTNLVKNGEIITNELKKYRKMFPKSINCVGQ